jgi:hypothetical protein
MEERMDSPIAASAAARAITKIAKMSPFNWRLSNSSENVTRFRLIEFNIRTRIEPIQLIRIEQLHNKREKKVFVVLAVDGFY